MRRLASASHWAQDVGDRGAIETGAVLYSAAACYRRFHLSSDGNDRSILDRGAPQWLGERGGRCAPDRDNDGRPARLVGETQRPKSGALLRSRSVQSKPGVLQPE